MQKQLIRVVYPTDDGRIALRTEANWDANIEPDSVQQNACISEFQIVDDILDVEGESRELGKTAGKDAADAKPTYPALFGIERSRLLAADAIGRAQSGLEEARLTEGWLGPIADWILNRRS